MPCKLDRYDIKQIETDANSALLILGVALSEAPHNKRMQQTISPANKFASGLAPDPQRYLSNIELKLIQNQRLQAFQTNKRLCNVLGMA